MQDSGNISAELAAAMLGGALFAVPILGWWPLITITTAVLAAQFITAQSR